MRKNTNSCCPIPYSLPSRYNKSLKTSAKRELCSTKSVDPFKIQNWDQPFLKPPECFIYRWMDGWDGLSKVSFNCVYTLKVYSPCTYVLIYILKNLHQDTYKFKNLISSWGVGVINIENTINRRLFRFLFPTLSFFITMKLQLIWEFIRFLGICKNLFEIINWKNTMSRAGILLRGTLV